MTSSERQKLAVAMAETMEENDESEEEEPKEEREHNAMTRQPRALHAMTRHAKSRRTPLRNGWRAFSPAPDTTSAVRQRLQRRLESRADKVDAEEAVENAVAPSVQDDDSLATTSGVRKRLLTKVKQRADRGQAEAAPADSSPTNPASAVAEQKVPEPPAFMAVAGQEGAMCQQGGMEPPGNRANGGGAKRGMKPTRSANRQQSRLPPEPGKLSHEENAKLSHEEKSSPHSSEKEESSDLVGGD